MFACTESVFRDFKKIYVQISPICGIPLPTLPHTTTINMEHSHKAGALKQTNKSHKQVKSSKRANKLSMGGRVEKSGHVTMKEKYVVFCVG